MEGGSNEHHDRNSKDRFDVGHKERIKTVGRVVVAGGVAIERFKTVGRVAGGAGVHAVEQHVRELIGVQLDESCSDVSRLCFLSHDPDAYLNANAVELAPSIETEKPAPTATDATCKSEIKARQTIAAELLGTIEWSTEKRGYCICPAQHLHTTGDGASDCEVYLDGAPTIHCFHNHCRGIIEATNRELRSRIGKAEQAAMVTPAQWFNKKFPTLCLRR